MISKLRKIVSEIAEQNDIKVENFKMDKIKLIEMHLDKDGDIEKAMKDLDKVLGFHWDKYYEQIEKELR